jgi:hypothetical protein
MRAEKAIWTREKQELNAEIKTNVAQTLQTHKMRMGMYVVCPLMHQAPS